MIPTRSQIHIGQKVWAVEKKNYASAKLTVGCVKRILTSKANHPRGIKVMFENGIVARVQRLDSPEQQTQTLKPKDQKTRIIEEDEIV